MIKNIIKTSNKDKLYILIIIILSLFFISISFILIKKDVSISKIFNKLFDERNIANVIIKYEKIINQKNELIENLKKEKKYEYNQSFFPKTQFLDLTFIDKKFNIDLAYSELSKIDKVQNKVTQNKNIPFYLDYFSENIFISSRNGEIFYFQESELDKIEKKINLIKIDNNLNKKLVVTDILIDEKNLYIGVFDNKECFAKIFKGEISLDKINFEEFFSLKMYSKCTPFPTGGRLTSDKEYVYFSTDAYLNSKNIENLDIFSNDHVGVILQIDKISSKSKLFSSGHRNVQGLIKYKDVLLSTEHGPRGGDEINKIIFNQNYGWPYASYGEHYYTSKEDSYELLKNHAKNDYIEPIFSYVPSIGISQIINVDLKFSEKWKNSFLVTSLNGGIIERITFNQNYSKIISKEKLKIGNRIRDIIYLKRKKVFLLALENNNASLGIIGFNN